jgi:hypothetical protein
MSTQVEQVRKLRAWWFHRQGLGGDPQSLSAAAILAKSGWARSVGGCGPYLTFFTRASMSREAVDQAVANLQIQELPSARGCTYIVPAEDFPLALLLAQNSGGGEMRVAEKLGVTAKEIEALCQAVVGALKKSPLDPDGIRQATGKAVRSLGPEGQKKGLASTLPVALERLQNTGEIRRIPTNGRLDQQRYRYALWLPNPLREAKLDFEKAAVELAKRFFSWIAPARLSEFQAFAGFGVKAAKAAVEPLKLEPISKDDNLLILPSDHVAFETFKPDKDPSYQLVSSLDSLLLLRRELTSLLDPNDATNWAGGGKVMELPSPAIIDRGRIVGLWEFDPASESIAYQTFVNENAQLKKAVAATENYIRNQLGDARAFSLDSPKSRIPRIEALRKAKKIMA